MAIEKLEAEVLVKAVPDKGSFDKASDYVKQENKRLNSEMGIKLSLDLANLRVQQGELRTLLQQAKKEGDKEAQITIQAKLETLREQINTAVAELKNFSKRGNTAVSGLDLQFKKVTDEIQKSRTEMILLGKSTGNLDKLLQKANDLEKEFKEGTISVQQYGKELGKIQSQANGASSGFGNLKTQLGGISSLLSGVFSIQKLTGVSDTFYSMQNSLRQVTNTEEELNYWQQRLLKTANESRAPVDDLTKAFMRFDLVNRQIGGTQEETLTILDSLSKGLTMTGATASETGSVILQLSQAFGSGVLQGDEFRSVAENMPMILDILAKKLGVTRGELKSMASDGVITSQILKEALIEANEQINESFGKSQKTIGQALTQIRNDFIVTFGDLDKNGGVTNGVVAGLEFIKNSVLSFIQVFPGLTGILGAGTIALGVFGGALTLLGGPITVTIGVIAGLVIGLGALYKTINDVETQLGTLQIQLEENQTQQNLLKKAYDEGKISLEEYQKQIGILTKKEEELQNQTQELEGSFKGFVTRTKAIILSTIKVIAGSIGTLLIGTGELIGNLIGLIINNVKLIPENFGIAFDNIPYFAQSGLNLALKKVEDFINKYKNLLNKIPGINIGDVNFSKISGASKKDYTFTGFSADNFKFTQKSFQMLVSEVDNFGKIETKKSQELSQIKIKENNKVTNNIIDSNNKIKGDSKKTNAELLKEQKAHDKQWEDIAKENNKKILEREKTKNDKLRNQAKLLEDGYKEAGQIYDDILKDNIRRTDDFIKKIDESVKVFEKLQQAKKDLESGKISDLSVRYTDVEDEIKKTQEDLKKIQVNDGISLDYAKQFGLDTLKQIGKDSELGGFKVGDLIEVLELHNKLNKLLEEQKLLKSSLTNEEIKEAQRQASLSPTQKYLEEYEIKKKQIENDISLERMRIGELEIQKKKEQEIHANLIKEQEILDENYKNMRLNIESQITDDLKNQTVQRMDLLEKVRLKAIQTAEALRSAGIATANAGTNQNSGSVDNSVNTSNSNNSFIINANISNKEEANNLIKQLDSYKKGIK